MKYFALKVYNSLESINPSYVAAAIDWSVNNGANVISMSLGGVNRSQEVEFACKNAYLNNVTIVASVGNDESAYPSYPAGFGPVIGVGACQSDLLTVWPLSNSGCDLVAPGVDVPTLGVNGECINITGTSYACPHVAGAVALWMSKFGKWSSNICCADEVRQILKISATHLDGILEWKQGAGLLNCLNVRYRRAFIRNAGFETADPYPWQQGNSGNIDYIWNVIKNNYPGDYKEGLGGDCHLRMQLDASAGNQDSWLMAYYGNASFLLQTNEEGKNATR